MMETDNTYMKELLRDARRNVEHERERMQEQIDVQNVFLELLDGYEQLQAENERLKSELEEQKAEVDSLHQQLDAKDMKLNEMNKFSVNMAKKSSQEVLEKAFRIYINTSKRKTQVKREAAKAQLLDFIATAKLEMPEDIMELLNHLDDEQVAEPAPVNNVVTVEAGGINVQQANTVVK